MKRRLIFIFFAIIVSISSVFSVPAAATVSSQIIANSTGQNFTFPDGKTPDEIIAEVYSESFIDRCMESTGQYAPDNYWIDPTVYVLEFHTSSEFVSMLSSIDAKGTANTLNAMFGAYPYIYIPIFSLYGETIRVTGHIRIYYDFTEECYRQIPLIKNATSEQFISGQVTHFLEDVDITNGFQRVANDLGLSCVSHPILISLATAHNDTSEKVLMIIEEESIYMYDFLNTVHSTAEVHQPVMTVNEYVTQRSDYEQISASQTTGYRGSSVGNAASLRLYQESPSDNSSNWLCIIPIAICTVGTVAVRIYYKKKTNR